MKAADLPMSEDQLLTNVLDAAKKLKLRTAHFRPAQTQTGRWVTPVQGDGKGFPDCVIVGPGGSLLRELKSATGSLSREQREWLGWLKAAGLDADVWKPSDWHSGRIQDELRAISRPRINQPIEGVPA